MSSEKEIFDVKDIKVIKIDDIPPYLETSMVKSNFIELINLSFKEGDLVTFQISSLEREFKRGLKLGLKDCKPKIKKAREEERERILGIVDMDCNCKSYWNMSRHAKDCHLKELRKKIKSKRSEVTNKVSEGKQ